MHRGFLHFQSINLGEVTRRFPAIQLANSTHSHNCAYTEANQRCACRKAVSTAPACCDKLRSAQLNSTRNKRNKLKPKASSPHHLQISRLTTHTLILLPLHHNNTLTHINRIQNTATNAQINQSRYFNCEKEEESRIEANSDPTDAFRRRATDPGP
jgi:hypothetical protein